MAPRLDTAQEALGGKFAHGLALVPRGVQGRRRVRDGVVETRRSWAQEAFLRAPEVDCEGQEGAPKLPKWSQHAAQKRIPNSVKLELVLDAVWKPSWGSKRVDGAAGRRNGGGLWWKQGRLKPWKELSQGNPTRPSARWAGGFKGLTPFRQAPEEVRSQQ